MTKPQLFLDHFYRVVPEEAFQEAKELLKIFPSSEHRRSDTDYGFWEGVYIHAFDGVYFEILREDPYWKPTFIALSMSQFGEEKDLHRQITEAYPEHQFSKSEINRTDGSPWMFCTMLDSAESQIFFYAEEYREAERQKRKEKGNISENWLQSIDQLEICADQTQLEKIAKSSNWFAKRVKTANNHIELSIPQKNHDAFRAVISKAIGNSRPFTLSGRYNEDLFFNKTPAIRFKHFQLEFKQGQYNLKFLG